MRCKRICVCVCVPSIKLTPRPMGLRNGEKAIILLSFGFLLSLHRSLTFLPVGLIRHSFPLSIRLMPPLSFFFSAPSLHFSSPTAVRGFMGCLLKCGGRTGSPFSPGSSPLPPLQAHRESLGVQLFPSLRLFRCMI